MIEIIILGRNQIDADANLDGMAIFEAFRHLYFRCSK